LRITESVSRTIETSPTKDALAIAQPKTLQCKWHQNIMQRWARQRGCRQCSPWRRI
jgi:hypothetical protein